MSERVKELAEREARLQERCAAQRASIAQELASIEARFERVDSIARVARTTLLHPVVIVGAVVALFTIGRSRGMRLVGRLYVLSTAVRRLVQTVRVFQGIVARPTPVQGEPP
ncbi:MAG TPA: YqjK family protein [Gammaproteobacteria bacterium]|nr:YqjK family protein [Gammaproteobacteria bacterium]